MRFFFFEMQKWKDRVARQSSKATEKELWFCEMRKRKDRMARKSFRALIPCRRPKSNEIIIERNIIKRDEENGG